MELLVNKVNIDIRVNEGIGNFHFTAGNVLYEYRKFNIFFLIIGALLMLSLIIIMLSAVFISDS